MQREEMCVESLRRAVVTMEVDRWKRGLQGLFSLFLRYDTIAAIRFSTYMSYSLSITSFAPCRSSPSLVQTSVRYSQLNNYAAQ